MGEGYDKGGRAQCRSGLCPLWAGGDRRMNLNAVHTGYNPPLHGRQRCLLFSSGGTLTSPGSSSGLTRFQVMGCRKDVPDQATSADTSTTTGSTSVSRTGPLSLLNLFREDSLISSGHGCPGPAGRRWRPSSRPAFVDKMVERPTIFSSPPMGRPAMMACGWAWTRSRPRTPRPKDPCA